MSHAHSRLTIAGVIAGLLMLGPAARAGQPSQPQAPAPQPSKPDEAKAEPPEQNDASGEAGKPDVHENAVAKANHPLTAAVGFNLQNFFVPAHYGQGGTSNQMLVRAIVPLKLGLQQVVRATLPLTTALPSSDGGDSKAGLGDLNVFDVVLLTRDDAELQFAIGPMATFPTAVASQLGAGKWQIGAASAIAWMPAKTVLLGAIVTWQASIASTTGGESRPGQDQLVAQPIGIFQVGNGFYLRSTASSVFNFLSGDYAVPFGIGAGKVVKVEGFAFNGFLEPQFTVLHSGVGQPAIQLLGGLTVQVF
jgi:hypothetical protein